MVMAPESLDVVVASNLFGDILTDLGAAIQGGLGFAASANINPERAMRPRCSSRCMARRRTSPVREIANPLAAIWSAAMMLDHLGEGGAAARDSRCDGRDDPQTVSARGRERTAPERSRTPS